MNKILNATARSWGKIAAVVLVSAATLTVGTGIDAHSYWHKTQHYYHTSTKHNSRAHLSDGGSDGPSTYGYVRVGVFNTNGGYEHGQRSVSCSGGCTELFTAYVSFPRSGHSHDIITSGCGKDGDGHTTPANFPAFTECQAYGVWGTSSTHAPH